MQKWYALYTKPRCERQVEQGLLTQGIETYLPLYQVQPRPGRPSERPFLPCYLFARVDFEVTARSRIQWMPGMRSVVFCDGKPAQVAENAIARIRERLSQSGALDAQGETLAQGDQVVITRGPFQNVDALFDQKLSAAGRVRVLIQLMQHWATVEMESNALRKVSVWQTQNNLTAR